MTKLHYIKITNNPTSIYDLIYNFRFKIITHDNYTEDDKLFAIIYLFDDKIYDFDCMKKLLIMLIYFREKITNPDKYTITTYKFTFSKTIHYD